MKLFLASLLAPCCLATTKLTILHYSDVHARVDPIVDEYTACPDLATGTGCVGGLARLAQKQKDIRKENPLSLILDAGDVFIGSEWNLHYQGSMMKEVYEKLDFDALTPGNHDFDFGAKKFSEFAKPFASKVVSCNIDYSKDSDTKKLNMPTAIIKEFKTAAFADVTFKVAIVGYTTITTPQFSNPGAIAFKKEADAVVACLGLADVTNADFIVLLSHAGLDTDKAVVKAIAGHKTNGKAWKNKLLGVFGGHDHIKIKNMPGAGKDAIAYPVVSDGVNIYKSFQATLHVGVVEFTLDASKGEIKKREGKIHSLDASVAEDKTIKDFITNKRKALTKALETKYGKATFALSAAHDVVRKDESTLANLMTDAMLYSVETSKDATLKQLVKDKKKFKAIVHAGELAADIPKGDITKGTVLKTFKYDNGLDVVKVTGTQIKAALENGVYELPKLHGKFPHVAGMSYVIDYKAKAGARIVKVIDNETGAEMVATSEFLVACPHFIAKGGYGYSSLAGAGDKVVEGVSRSTEVAKVYIQHKKTVGAIKEGRIRPLDNSAHGASAALVAILASYFSF